MLTSEKIFFLATFMLYFLVNEDWLKFSKKMVSKFITKTKNLSHKTTHKSKSENNNISTVNSYMFFDSKQKTFIIFFPLDILSLNPGKNKFQNVF